jgi:chromosome segregation ATPase
LQCLDDKDQESLDSRKSDFWSLGVVGFEMITGKTPFSDEHSIVNTYSNIMKNSYSSEMSTLSPNLRSLLESLLTDVEKRSGYEELIRHSFFNTVDWDGLSSSCSPFIPELKDMYDTSHFDVDRKVPKTPNPSFLTTVKKYDPVVGFSYAGKHSESMRYSRQFGGDDCSDMVASLRRQNEDLRLKLSKLEREQKREQRNASLHNDTLDLKNLCQQESKELRGTIGKLEKLLEIERQERSMAEKKSLELLTDLKKKWQEREEERVEQIQNALKKSEAKREKMEMELQDANKILIDREEEIKSLQDLKSSLKTKLKECKNKLVEAQSKFHNEIKKNKDFEENNSIVMENELKAKDYENSELMKTIDDYRENTDKLEEEIAKLRKEVANLRRIDNDQKETIQFLKEEKQTIEEHHGLAVTKIRAKLVEKEKTIEEMTSKVSKLEEENETAKCKLQSKDEKLSSLESLLEKLENKIRPFDKLSADTTKDSKEEIQHLKDELSLKRIDVRLLERKNKELEERIKFRVTMAKEEKEEKDKIEAQLKEMTDKLKPLENEVENLGKNLERAQQKIKDFEENEEKLKKTISELRSKEAESKSLQSEKDRLAKRVEKLEEEIKSNQDLKEAYEKLKGICLEQEDQSNEYESVLSKLEAKLEQVTKAKERFEKEVSELSQTGSTLRIERNELKSKLIFTETQLKEVREKHNDIESLYKKEEETWREKIAKMSSSKNEQSDALVKMKSQLSLLAQNYERASDESTALREQNLQLKEDLSEHITSIQSLKESNFKLHQVIEEAMGKIERRNVELANCKESLEMLKEDKDRKDNENHVHIEQLKKLIEHLREKNAILEGNTKGKNSKKRPAEPYLTDEFHKLRTPSRNPLKSPGSPRKMSRSPPRKMHR